MAPTTPESIRDAAGSTNALISPPALNNAGRPTFFKESTVNTKQLFPEPVHAEALFHNSEQSAEWTQLELKAGVSIASLFLSRDTDSIQIKRPRVSPRTAPYSRGELQQELDQIATRPQVCFGDRTATFVVYSVDGDNKHGIIKAILRIKRRRVWGFYPHDCI